MDTIVSILYELKRIYNKIDFLTKRVEELEAEGNKNMATFEQNTNEIIEKIVRNLDTITDSIVDLYGKIEELNKSIERVKNLTVDEVKEVVPCIMCDGIGCSFCNDTGKMTVVEDVDVSTLATYTKTED